MKTRTRNIERKRDKNEKQVSDADVLPSSPQVPASQSIPPDRPVVPSTPVLQDTGDCRRVEEIERQSVNSESGHAEAGLYGVEEIPRDQAAYPEVKRFPVSHPDLPSLSEETSSSSPRVDSGDKLVAKEVSSL